MSFPRVPKISGVRLIAGIRKPAATVGGLLVAFVVLLIIAEQAGPTELDKRFAGSIQAIGWGGFDFVPRLSSELGGGFVGFYAAPVGVVAIFAIFRRWHALLMLAALFILHFALISPKLYVTTYRPSPAFGVEGDGGLQSFPSGHVQWAASFYGFLAYLTWRGVPTRLRFGALPVYVAVVLGTMLGRIELGRHWPIDTVGGVLAGLIALRLVMTVSQKSRGVNQLGTAVT